GFLVLEIAALLRAQLARELPAFPPSFFVARSKVEVGDETMERNADGIVEMRPPKQPVRLFVGIVEALEQSERGDFQVAQVVPPGKARHGGVGVGEGGFEIARLDVRPNDGLVETDALRIEVQRALVRVEGFEHPTLSAMPLAFLVGRMRLGRNELE